MIFDKISHDTRYTEDIKRICRVMIDNNYSISFSEAIELWVEHSEKSAAGWLGLPETDSELFEILKEYIDE